MQKPYLPTFTRIYKKPLNVFLRVQVSISNSSENNEIINSQKNINDAYDRNLKDFTDIIKLYFPESGLFR